MLIFLVISFLLIGCNQNSISDGEDDLQSLPIITEPEPPLIISEEPTKENEREGEEILLETALINKAKLLSNAYSEYVGKSIGELKNVFPDIRFIGLKSEDWDHACDAYAVSEDEKVFYLAQGQQSLYYGVPNEFQNDFSRISDLHIWGLYGEIGILFPEIDRNLSVEVLGELLGVNIERIYDNEKLHVFVYEGYRCVFNIDVGSIIISPETIIELSYDFYSSDLVSKERLITDALWLEIDPEGAAHFYEFEKIIE
jgi:hypothetical protein